MKNYFLPSLLLLTMLSTACSTTTFKSTPLSKINDLKHICIKDAENPKLPEFTQLIAQNLKVKGITSEIRTELPPRCRYALAYSLNQKDGLIHSAKLRVSEMNYDERTNLGEVSYWLTGEEEKANVAQTGLKGQVDNIVNELFKYY
ncbi:MAG: hypothetical protein Q4D86_02485 [Pasteurella oralis]|uniref:hypothetical protein n=1 Tax=Pasteurella oralis TaxID=1071947 RepID=UPI0026FE1328|nr:hypothetical protein [Pasteurella oralis]